MNCLIYALYVTIVGLIRIYKWIEYRILLLFTPILKRKGIKLAASIGVILHCPDENITESKPTSESADCKILVEKLGGKYDRLVHINVKDMTFFAKWANLGSLGGGEGYVDGIWEIVGGNMEDFTEFGRRALESNLMDNYYNPWNKFLEWLELYAFNLQTRKRAFHVAKKHYDLGNDLYELMLDPWMQYTCAYWKNATDLNQAQLDKLDLIARKLDLKPGMRVLDIGCGWGTLCKYLAENYQVSCVGITISNEGVAYGRKICQDLPVDIRLQDYREINEKFDRVVSIGMMEHAGHWNYRELMKVAERCMVDDGIFLLHTIGRHECNFWQRSEPWVDKYIFPNGQLPSSTDVTGAIKTLFVIEDWHNFGMDYAKTLDCWREKFIRGWPSIREKYGGERFFRIWTCYLSHSRAMFLSRRAQLWQIVLSKDGLKTNYRAVR